MIEGTVFKDCVKDNSSLSLIEYCGGSESEFLYKVYLGNLEQDNYSED